MKKLVYALLALTLFAVFGCTGDTNTNSSSITAPNPNPFQPKGTVTGVLTDRITNEPLANAKVMIMDKSATTNSAGVFTITDVPANTPVGNEPATGATAANTYNAVIDMTAINSAIDTFNADAANTVKKAKYPAFAYSTVQVKYDSLGDALGTAASGGVNGGNATNHDTPVDGFVASMAPTVGKLDGNLQIQVVDSKQQVVNNVAVTLYATGGATNAANPVANVGVDGEVNTTTGNLNHLVGTATTDANGLVTFSNVEAGAVFRANASIAKSNTPGSNALTATGLFVAPGDGETRGYLNQQDKFNIVAGATVVDGNNDALALASVDLIAPMVIETTPATLADIAANAATVVTFKFSEPIMANNYALALTEGASQNGGLWKDVYVNFDGPKAGNLQYTLAWNADMTELSVTIATVAASKYTVSIDGSVGGATVFAVGKLVDADNVATVATANGNGTVNFTTSGGNVVTAPNLTRSNDTTIDWEPVANALQYRVYVAQYRNGVLVNPAFAVSTQTDTHYVLAAAPFVIDQIPQTYKVKVIAMGTASVESAGATSAETTLNDTTTPSITALTAVTNFPAARANLGLANAVVTRTVTVTFSELMNRSAVQTVGSWSIRKAVVADPSGIAYLDANAPAVELFSSAAPQNPAITGVTYNAATNVATITMTTTQNAAATGSIDFSKLIFTFTGTDVNGNAIKTTANEAGLVDLIF